MKMGESGLLILVICLISNLLTWANTSSVVVLQLNIPERNRTWVHALSHTNAFNYAQIHGYEYRLIDWKRSQYQLDEWHPSWYAMDAIRQTLQDVSVDMVLFVGENTILTDLESDLSEYFEMTDDENIEIAFPEAIIPCLENINSTHCDKIPWTIQVWKNSDEVRYLLEYWIRCVDYEIKFPSCYHYRILLYPYAFGVLGRFYRDELPSRRLEYISCENHTVDEFLNYYQTNPTSSYCSTIVVSVNDTIHVNMIPSPSASVVVNADNYDPVFIPELPPHHVMQQINSHLFNATRELTFLRDICPSNILELDVYKPLNDGSDRLAVLKFRINAYDNASLRIDDCVKGFQLPEHNCSLFLTFVRTLQEVRFTTIANCNSAHFVENALLLSHERERMKVQLGEQALSPPRKIIVTIFAGRYDRLQLTMKYWRLALDKKMIDEVHLWDYCRNETDRIKLKSFVNIGDDRVQIKKKYSKRMHWIDYYEYYETYSKTHLNDIIIKCDDDIVFMDLKMLNHYIFMMIINPTFAGVLFPNIINNGVGAYLQQKVLRMLPTQSNDPKYPLDDYEYPKAGLEGSLWQSPRKANNLHQYFLHHWRELLPSPPNKVYQPETIQIETRFSINFFGIRADQWFRIRNIGLDDEFHLTVTLPLIKLMGHYVYSNFIVSHLTYSPQSRGPQDLNETALLAQYDELFYQYSATL